MAFTTGSCKLLPWEISQEFIAEKDHKALSWLNRMKDTNARLTRWALQIQPYRFELKYGTGNENANAGGLSRAHHLVEEMTKDPSKNRVLLLSS